MTNCGVAGSYRIVGLVEAERSLRADAVERILKSRALLAAVLSISVRLAVGVSDAQRDPPRIALVHLELQAVVERVAEAVDEADRAERLQAQLYTFLPGIRKPRVANHFGVG